MPCQLTLSSKTYYIQKKFKTFSNLLRSPNLEKLMHLYRPATIVETGLWKSKSESGTNVAMYEVFLLTLMMLFMGSKYLEYISSITVMHNDNNNQT
jgi:hypothetical protein